MTTTKTGVKITVDTSDIDVKFLKSVDQLNAGLTRTQKKLGLVYNEQGLLTNALGQTVEGLSISQIKLGQYVDELGRVRTFQDGYTEGLSKTQLALGMYTDELGNVYNATGEMIGQTDKAAKALEKEAAQAAKQAAAELETLRKAADETADKLDEIGKGIETATQQLGGLGANLRKLGDSLHNDTIKKAGSIIDTLLAARAAAANIRSLSQSITGLTSQLLKAKTAAQALDIVTKSLGGPLGATAAALCAIDAAVNMLDPLPQIQPISDEFKKIEEYARRAGGEIRNFGDVLKNGAFSFSTPVDELKQATERIKDAKDALDKAKRERAEADALGFTGLTAAGAATGASGGAAAGGVGAVPGAIVGAVAGAGTATYLHLRAGKHVEAAENEYKNVMAEANGVISKYVEDARKNAMTAAERLEEQKNVYNDILESAKRATAPAEVQAALEKQIADIDKQIADAKEQERQGALQAAGMKGYVDAAAREQAKSAQTIEEFNKTLEEWKKQVENGVATQEEYNASLGQKQKEIAAQLAETYGVGTIDFTPAEIDPAEKERLEKALKDGSISLEAYREQIDQLRQAAAKAKDEQAETDLKARFEAGEISAEQYNALLAALQKKRAAQLEKELETETDAQKVAERWRQALEAGRIAQADYNAKIKSLEEAATQEAERKREEERAALMEKTGVSFEKPQTPETPLESYSKNVEALKEALEKGTVGQEEYNDAIGQLKDKAREAFPALEKMKEPDATATVKDFGEGANEILKGGEVSKETEKAIKEAQASVRSLTTKGQNLNEESLTAIEQYNKTIEQAADAYRQGILEKKDYDAVLAAATGDLSEELKKQQAEVEKSKQQEKEAREKQRASTRSKLGIDSMLEEMKSPLEKYQETMNQIAAAVKEGSINRKEMGMLEEKAASDYWERMNDLSQTAQRGAEKLEKMELGRSSSTGSESLYLAMIKQSQNGFQNKIQASTDRIAAIQSQSLNESQLTNMYLATLVETGGVGVFRG